ncbi:MAG TPA: M20/M25/M40 family metallo-hydrolase [Planctomycetota bacterium]|nr:M20/M25/M40 family metallo-hydrolase [Planctomycetota bacterium]
MLDRVFAQIDDSFAATVERLKRLVRIPSCSFPGFDHAHIDASAADAVAWLRESGFPETRIARLPGVLPYVIAKDHRAGPGKPTLLLYAHHDVQPPLRETLWRTPVFEPTEIAGRLYGRGTVDDKAGVAVHCASAAAWNAVAGAPPINLTVLIEGEEEIGSPHFAEFLRAHRDELAADCLVIADLANYDTGLPSLTTSLRGLVEAEVGLRALRAPLHSGMWGGGVPDPTLGLCRLLATLTDGDGRIAIAGMHDSVRPPTPAEIAAWRRLPYDPDHFARMAGLAAGRGPADPVELHRRMWREPALSVSCFQAGERGKTGNVIMDAAWARIGIRIVPDMKPERVRELLESHLRRHAPTDMELTISGDENVTAWSTVSDHPAFAAAGRALRRGYDVAPVLIGCGASIPFVGEMTAALGGIPALLMGIEDPTCGAHAENESLHLGDFRKAIRAQAALFVELGAALARHEGHCSPLRTT